MQFWFDSFRKTSFVFQVSNKRKFANFFVFLSSIWAFPTSNNSNHSGQCGVAKPDADNGYVAAYPFAAHIEFDVGYCSGSIIDRHHILTAAHCFFDDKGNRLDATTYTVTVGATDYESTNAKKYKPESVVLHPNYVYDPHDVAPFDVAVLTLKEPIEFNARIGPICLDSVGAKAGETVIAAGWGLVKSAPCGDKYVKGHTTILHQGKMRIARECVRDPKSEICAIGVNAVIERGDSGGLLMVEREGHWYQIGINCARSCAERLPENQHDLFMSVAFFHDWIIEQTR